MNNPDSECNIVCMKWGTKFSPFYVNRLRSMVRRHMQAPHRFVCLTDDPAGLDADIETLPLPDVGWSEEPDINQHGWRKVGLFAPGIGDLRGTILFLDLDIVILDAMEPLFSHPGEVCMIRDFRLLRLRRDYFVGNTSVLRFPVGRYPELYERFRKEFPTIRDREVRNEQEYLSHYFHNRGILSHWPRQWCLGFKRHCVGWGLKSYLFTPKFPDGAKMVIFHGNPSPEQAIKGQGGKWYRHIRPTPWVAEHWV